MGESSLTCWTLIRGAAEGSAADRSTFARRYEDVIRSYLRTRWRGGPLAAQVDDAVQEVFVDCLRPHGALERADPERGAFRGFLYGVVRNVALRQERARSRAALPLDASYDPPAEDASLAQAFDRAWAQALLREAGRLQQERALGDARAERRVELLRLRFGEDAPIRDIAVRWGVAPDWLHHEYATARDEYRRALREIVAFHRPEASPAAIDDECRHLIGLFA